MVNDGTVFDCCIVGSGICGLTLANELKDMDIVVLDKGKGTGGRVATRRITHNDSRAVFDYGAQFFTATNPEFVKYVGGLVENNVVKTWFKGPLNEKAVFKNDGKCSYIGYDGLRSITKHMAKGLDVRQSERVDRLFNRKKEWVIHTDSNISIRSRLVVLTSPVPQSLSIIEQSGISLDNRLEKELRKVAYDPCIALLVVCSGKSLLPEPGGIMLEDCPVTWIADNAMKGISKESTAITIHCSADFSRKNWAMNDKDLFENIMDSIGDKLGCKAEQYQIHRWLYSKPVSLFGSPFAHTRDPGLLYFAGDAFVAPKIEGAFISGMKTAGHIKKYLQSS